MARTSSWQLLSRLALPAWSFTLAALVACSGGQQEPDGGAGTGAVSAGRANGGAPPTAGTPALGGNGGRSTGGSSGMAGSSGGVSGTSAAGSGGADMGGAGGRGGVSGNAGESGSSGMGGAGGKAGEGAMAGSAGRDGTSGRAGEGGTSGAGATAGAGGASGAGAGGVTGVSGAPPVGRKFVGNIDTRGQIREDFAQFWNQFSAENAGKWGSVERTRGQMNWSSLDRMYEYARARNIIVKQHTFVWGTQQPEWLDGLPQSEQRAEVEEWIRLFCERYPDTQIIDVVNEPPPHTTPPYVAALGGSGSSGYDWIAQAFRWAHQYCPDAILILNDYNNIEYQADNARTIEIVNKIKSAGAPIHAVGAQAHDAFKISTGTVQMYIDRIADQTGLPVYISEYDIDLADDNQQRSVMESQFTMFWNNENVVGITLWGYIEGMTWKRNTGLMSSDGSPRPAMTWLIDFLDL